MKASYLKKVGDSIIFDGEYMEIYIPKSNFDKGISAFTGEYLHTLGVFNFIVYPEGKESKEKGELHSLKLAFKIKIAYSSFFSSKAKLSNDLDEDSYMVFTLNRGDIFVLSTAQEKSSANTKELVSLIHGGNLPKSIPYGDVLTAYVDAMNLNGVNLNSQMCIFEFIIAELCRYKQDLNIPFRMIIGKDPSTSEFDYTSINLKRLPALNSTFGALTFEDINQSIISSLKKSKNGEEEKESPIEKVMKY